MRALAALVIVAAACSPAAAPPGTASPTATSPAAASSPGAITMREFPVPAGSGPHDVAPAADGGVWFTAQRSGHLGWLDPKTGRTRMIPLGAGSAPHGVIVDDAGVAWVTDSGQNAIVSVDPRANDKVAIYKLPGPNVNLNTAAFDRGGTLWFTGQAGYFGRLVPGGTPEVSAAPRGRGPYGITASRTLGDVYYASLAGSHIARIFSVHGEVPGGIAGFDAQPIDPPTRDQGARRVWSDSRGHIWVSEWNAGQVARYDPTKEGADADDRGVAAWKEWKLPGDRPQAYAVYVDDQDVVWLSDFGSSTIARFDPASETFQSFPYQSGGGVRQLHGRPGEVWGALSSFDKLILLETR